MAKNFFKAPVKTIEGLSGPALLVLLTAVIGMVIVLLPGDVLTVSPQGTVAKVKINFWERLLTVVITQLPVLAILVYAFNCLSRGHCTTFAWVLAAVLFVFQIMAVMSLIVLRTA